MVSKHDATLKELEPKSPFLDEEAYDLPTDREARHDRCAKSQSETPFASAFTSIEQAETLEEEEDDPEEEGLPSGLQEEIEEPEAYGEQKVFSESETGIIDGDNRVRVKKTDGVPWRWICKVSLFEFEGDRYHSGGTGVLISDRHVLTAAHVVHEEYIDPAKYYIMVTPAFGGKKEEKPFGKYLISAKPKIPDRYDPKAKDHNDWDYALITLKERIGEKKFNGKPLCYWGHRACGAGTVFARLDPRGLVTKAAVTAGYPKTKGGNQMWCAAGLIVVADRRRRTMRMTADTTKGQSGSPVWVRENQQYCMVGIAAGAEKN